MENALNASQTELDASGEALKQARTELEANRGNTCRNNGFTNNGTSGTDGPSCRGEQRMADIKYSDAGTDHAKRCDADRYC